MDWEKEAEAEKQRAEEISQRIYSNMSYTQKYHQVLALREFAWQVKTAAVKQQYPQLGEAEVFAKVREFFLYGYT